MRNLEICLNSSQKNSNTFAGGVWGGIEAKLEKRRPIVAFAQTPSSGGKVTCPSLLKLEAAGSRRLVTQLILPATASFGTVVAKILQSVGLGDGLLESHNSKKEEAGYYGATRRLHR